METLVSEVIKQVPSLGVLCFIVYVFLRHMEKRDAVIKEIHEEHLNERRETRTSVDNNTKAMAVNTVAIHELAKALKE